MDNNNNYAFCALVSRMKHIGRWGLMRSNRPENLAEHTAETAIIAHILALVAKDIFGDGTLRPDSIAVAALYHDSSEILTGDMPTPVKYKNDVLRSAYKNLEKESAETLASLLPQQIQPTLAPLLTGSALNETEAKILKCADSLSALIKCIEEEAGGNTEFSSAKAQHLRRLEALEYPPLDYFLRHFLPCYEKNLDQLTGGF